MFFGTLLFALFVGLVLTFIFTALLDVRGPWGSFWTFFLVVALAVWAGSVWLTPFGPPLFGIYWLPALLIGIVFALLLAAVTPPAAPPATAEPVPAGAAVGTALAVNIFFWIFLGLLFIIALVALF